MEVIGVEPISLRCKRSVSPLALNPQVPVILTGGIGDWVTNQGAHNWSRTSTSVSSPGSQPGPSTNSGIRA